MTRPDLDPSVLQSNIEAWDSLLRDLLTAGFRSPFAVAEFANFAALPPATSYDRCLATTVSDSKLWFSSGGTWKEVTLIP